MKPVDSIISERIRRCKEANTSPEIRMRYCESCEVPIGTMPLERFEKLETCPNCGQLIHVLKEAEPDPLYVNITNARIRFGLRYGRIKRAIKEGRIRTKETSGLAILMSEADLIREFGISVEGHTGGRND